jgi:hypothetical protein
MLTTTAMTMVAAPLCFIAPYAVERFGRRPLFLTISALSTLEILFVAFAQLFVDSSASNSSSRAGDPSSTSNGYAFVPAAVLGVFGCTLGQAAVTLGLLNMTALLIGELCPHAMRVTYPVLIGGYGVLFFMPMLAASVFLLVLMWRYLPETRGLPVGISGLSLFIFIILIFKWEL